MNNPGNCVPPPPIEVCVNYRTVPGTATRDVDYVHVEDSLRFTAVPAGTSYIGTGRIFIPVPGDTLSEGPETFSVVISGSVTCLANATIQKSVGIGTIVDDEPTVSVNDVDVIEGNAGTTSAAFNVTLSEAASVPVRVDYNTADVTATKFVDYSPVSGTLELALGDLSKTVEVPIIGDTVNERDETFAVDLSNAFGVAIADPHGIGTIADDDPSTLRLLSIVCRRNEDTLGNDEPYLKLAGRVVWSNNDFSDGESASLTSVPARAFTGSITLELYEDDVSPNAGDFLGRKVITEADAGPGPLTAKFTGNGAEYVITYRVD